MNQNEWISPYYYYIQYTYTASYIRLLYRHHLIQTPRYTDRASTHIYKYRKASIYGKLIERDGWIFLERVNTELFYFIFSEKNLIKLFYQMIKLEYLKFKQSRLYSFSKNTKKKIQLVLAVQNICLGTSRSFVQAFTQMIIFYCVCPFLAFLCFQVADSEFFIRIWSSK